jgi:hypothetical protein
VNVHPAVRRGPRARQHYPALSALQRDRDNWQRRRDSGGRGRIPACRWGRRRGSSGGGRGFRWEHTDRAHGLLPTSYTNSIGIGLTPHYRSLSWYRWLSGHHEGVRRDQPKRRRNSNCPWSRRRDGSHSGIRKKLNICWPSCVGGCYCVSNNVRRGTRGRRCRMRNLAQQ